MAAVLGMTVGGFLLMRDGGASRCAWSDVPPARVSSYEWRQTTWRSPAAREQLVRDADQLCLDRVYVDITEAALVTGAERDALASDLASLVALADEQGIEVGAVAGDPWWPSPQGEIDADLVLDLVAELEADGTALAAFHVDAEPWGLEEWPDQKRDLSVAYLEFVQHLEERRAARGLATPVVYLIPYWFDGSNGEAPSISFGGESRYPFDHLVDILGDGAALSVMAYRDRALGEGGIVDLVQHEIEQDRVPVLVGVETAPIDPPTATFAGADLSTLHDELRLVADRTATSEIVVNDFPNLWNLATAT